LGSSFFGSISSSHYHQSPALTADERTTDNEEAVYAPMPRAQQPSNVFKVMMQDITKLSKAV
jgi:hypothetical protein